MKYVKYASVIVAYLIVFALIAVGGYFSLEFAWEAGLDLPSNRYIAFIVWCSLMFLSYLFAYLNKIEDNLEDSLYWGWAIASLLAIATSIYTFVVSKDFLKGDLLTLPHKANISIRLLVYMLPVSVGSVAYQTFVTHDDSEFNYEDYFALGFIPLGVSVVLFSIYYVVHEFIPLNIYNWIYWISTIALMGVMLFEIFTTDNCISGIFESAYEYSQTPEYKKEKQKEKDDQEMVRMYQDALQYQRDSIIREFYSAYGYSRDFYGHSVTKNDIDVYIEDSTLYVKATPEIEFNSYSDMIFYAKEIDKALLEKLEDCASYAVGAVDTEEAIGYSCSVDSKRTYWD